MGIFDKVLGKSEDKPLNASEGFAGIALCAVAADGVITEEEAFSLGVNMMTKKLYSGMSDRDLNEIFRKLVKIVQKEGLPTLIQKSAEAVPAELKPTAFAVATDLLLADGVFEDSEKIFLESLQKALGISDQEALKIADVISIKNKG